MNYRSPKPKIAFPPPGIGTPRGELAPELRKRFASLAKEHAEGGTESSGAGQAQRVTFKDGTLWFPRGIEKDNPAIIYVLVFGVAGFALAMLSFGALDEPGPFPFWMPIGAVVAAAVAARYWKKYWSVYGAAVKDIAMGTLAMEDCLALVAYDEVVLVEKERIEDFVLVRTRRKERRSSRLHVVFVDDRGESCQRYVGFLFGSDQQEAETNEVQRTLKGWLSAEEAAEEEE